MTLRELLDAATPGPWAHQGHRTEGMLVSTATGTIVCDPYTPNPQDERLIELAPELARLVLDMADALRPLVTEDSFVYDGGNTRDDIRALLARLDRISTQTDGTE